MAQVSTAINPNLHSAGALSMPRPLSSPLSEKASGILPATRIEHREIPPYSQTAVESKENGVYTHVVKTDDELSAMFELIKVLRRHGDADGWTLLLAPEQVPGKAVLDCFDVDKHKVMVVHDKQIVDLYSTVEQAMIHSTCAAVVAWSDDLSPRALGGISEFAQRSQCHFYVFNKHGAQSDCTQTESAH